MADSGPPSYSDVQAAHRARSELKQNFVTLRNDQLDIQELFRTVATELESTPEIGTGHELCDEWNDLRQVRCVLHSRQLRFHHQPVKWRAIIA